jgi:hypothetical protein
MDVEQQILHTTLRIEGQTPDGKLFFATGFIFQHQTPAGSVPFLISNKHVLLSNASSLKVTGLKKTDDGNPDYGNPVAFSLNCKNCGRYHVFGHPDAAVDVAAIAIGDQIISNPLFFRALAESNFLPPDGSATGLRRGTFEVILFVGYPNGLYDSHNVLPIARFGRVATQLELDYLGKPQFLIDASVFGGSSGSPVFVYRKYHRTSTTEISFGAELYFVGVLAAVHSRSDRGHLVPAHFAVEFNKELNLGLVFKCTTVLDVVKQALKLASHDKSASQV